MKTYGTTRCDTCKKDITKEAQCYDRKLGKTFCKNCNYKVKYKEKFSVSLPNGLGCNNSLGYAKMHFLTRAC